MCVHPIIVRGDQTVNCGRCELCLQRRISEWSFRLMQEQKRSDSAYFLTLTYDTKHVPLTRNGFMSLNPEHLQLFFKRVRKRQSDWKGDCNILRSIKYYAVGEYGGKFKRPHYHMVIFNADLRHIVETSVFVLVKNGVIKLDGKQNMSSHTWPYGYVSIGAVSAASCGYCCKYISKGAWRPRHVNDDRVGHFSRMSKGIGIGYLTENMCEYHVSQVEKMAYVTIGDVKLTMPRYYKEKLYFPDELLLIAAENEKRVEKRESEMTLDEKISRYEAGKASIINQHFKNFIKNEQKQII